MPNTQNTRRGHLIVLIGVPGSGKSTAAQRLLDIHGPNAYIVELDAFRAMLTSNPHAGPIPATEHIIRSAADHLTRGLLAEGRTVILSATHLCRSRLVEVANMGYRLDATVECVPLHTPLRTAIERVALRVASGGRPVPADVIHEMAAAAGIDPDTGRIPAELYQGLEIR